LVDITIARLERYGAAPRHSGYDWIRLRIGIRGNSGFGFDYC